MALRETTPQGERRQPLPILFVVAVCCMVGVWCAFQTGLIGADVEAFPLLLSGVLLGFIAVFEIRVGLAVLLLAIGLSPEIKILGIDNFRYEDVIFPILMMVWLIRHTIQRNTFVKTDLKMPILIMVFLGLITTLNNLAHGTLEMQTAILRFGKSVEYYFMFLLVLNTLKGPRDVNGFAALMLIASGLVGIYGLTQFNLVGDVAGGFRVSGPPGETANVLGGYYVFHMCLAMGLMAHARPGVRFVLFGYLVLMAVPFVHTMSRTSYVALAAGFIVIWLRRRDGLMGALLLVMLLVVVFSPSGVTDRALSIFTVLEGEGPSSWQSRVAGWKLLLAFAVNAPLLGKGVGALPLGAADNEYMLQLHELGIFGLLTFVWLMSRCVRTGFRMQKDDGGDRGGQGFALGYFGGVIALLVHSIGATTFTAIRTTEPFFFATGLLYVYLRHRRKDTERQEEYEKNMPLLLMGRQPPPPSPLATRPG